MNRPKIPKIAIETITPEMAKTMLEGNVNNRHVRPQRVKEYAADMAAGRWLLTGETIVINDGSLINGQHRLLACVEAGVPFRTAIARDVDADAFRTIDGGTPRTMSDRFAQLGAPDPTVVSAATRLVYLYENNSMGNKHALPLTAQIVEAAYESKDDKVWKIGAEFGRRANRYLKANQSAWCAFYVLASEVSDTDLVAEFLESVLQGVNLQAGDPRIALRNWISSAPRGRNNADGLAALARAWNAWTSGQELKQVRSWVRGQPFPVIEPFA